MEVPTMLKKWFIVHFITDMVFAIPLMIVPELFLNLMGWLNIDPISSRIVAAALFGIGIESFLVRNSGIESYRNMLKLKIIWSSATIIGMILSLFYVQLRFSFFVVAILVIFVLFNILWVFWFIKIKSMQ